MVDKRKEEESFKDYKTRVMDSKSASFCGAKWYNATIWLGHGQTTSCHLPASHAIPLEELLRKRQLDFKTFYTQYDARRGLNFRETFDPIMVDWYDTLKMEKSND